MTLWMTPSLSKADFDEKQQQAMEQQQKQAEAEQRRKNLLSAILDSEARERRSLQRLAQHTDTTVQQ